MLDSMRRSVIAAGAWNRIVAAWVERMAFHYPAQRIPAAFQCPMNLNRLQGIAGTNRVKAAIRTEERAQKEAIAPNQKGQNLLHLGTTTVAKSQIDTVNSQTAIADPNHHEVSLCLLWLLLASPILRHPFHPSSEAELPGNAGKTHGSRV